MSPAPVRRAGFAAPPDYLIAMCSRFRSIHAAENSARALREHLRPNFPSGWNVAPTDLAPIVIGTMGTPEGVLGRFGFVKWGRLKEPKGLGRPR